MHMEHIISFGENISDQNRPFFIEMAGITYPDPNYHIVRRHSPIHCFEYVIDGEGTVQVDEQINHPVKGDLYILPKGRNHDYFSSPERPFKKIWMNISGSLCDEMVHVYQLTGVLLVKQIDVYSLFQEFLSICENKELSLDEIYRQCSLVFHKLVIHIADHLSAEQKKPEINGTAEEIKAYIDRNIYEHLTIETVAKQIGLSPSQINRVFKASFELTPYEYILTRKISTAKLLLKNTNLTVKEIAYKLNFADEHYFSNVFYKRTGKRPGKYQAERKTK